MNAFAGTAGLIRLVLRRERIALPLWIILLALFVVGTAAGLGGLYATPEARATFAGLINRTLAEVALLGRAHGSSLGALTAWRLGTSGALLLSVMSLLTITRHTRAEEDSGRRELIGAAPLGRLAPLAAVVTVTLAANLCFALLAALGLRLMGLPFAGALLLGLSLAGCGWVFTGVSAILAQLAPSARSAGALVGVLLGLAYGLRIVGDGAGVPLLTWLSPLGWVGEAHAFAENRWPVLFLPLTFSLLLLGLALAWQQRRDLGAALLPARPGPAHAAPALGTPLALAWRLQRGLLLVWGLAYLGLGLLLGWLAQAAGAQIGQSPALAGAAGASGTDTLFTLGLDIFGGELLAVYALLAALRPRGEEAAGLADPLLALPVARLRWLGGHLLIALVGAALVLAAFGLGSGFAYGLSVGNVAHELARLLAASLAYLPAAWVLVGIATALTGLLPRLGALSWGLLGLFLVIDVLGEFRRANPFVQDLSPFSHVPRLLVETGKLGGLAWLVLAAALFMWVGLFGWRRRDLE